MPTRNSSAQWNGDLRSGSGSMRLGSGAYEGQFSFASRFESGTGTNPEELIAAAHAGCFSMAFSNILSQAGHTPTSVRTTAAVHLEMGADGPSISKIDLETVGVVPGITPEQFAELAATAKTGCPVSKALASVEITLDARLENA